MKVKRELNVHENKTEHSPPTRFETRRSFNTFSPSLYVAPFLASIYPAAVASVQPDPFALVYRPHNLILSLTYGHAPNQQVCMCSRQL